MGARRASLRPQPPTWGQRVLIAAIVFFTVGSVVCFHEIANGDWPLDASAMISSHLRSATELPVLDRAISSVQSEPDAPAIREFLRQRASVLSEDQCQVVAMARHAWGAYQAKANWSDLLDVVDQKGATVYDHTMAFTAVDSLDTLLIMGLHDEFDNATEWIKDHFEEAIYVPGNVSMYEALTRTLGGLLAAHYLSGDPQLLRLASELGEDLEKGFSCGIFVPCQQIDLLARAGHRCPSLAGASSFQLEFRYLAQLTKTPGYVELIDNFNALSVDLTADFYSNGLVPVSVNWDQIKGTPSEVSFGVLGDSYYEYQLKQWIQTGKKDEQLKQSYLTAIDGLQDVLVGHSQASNLTYISHLASNGKRLRKMDHTSCFVPGLLALGNFHGMPNDHLELAKELMETCMQMYLRSASNLAPDVVHFNDESLDEDFTVLENEDCNFLQPETVESLLVLYRVTQDEKYRDYGRQIMAAFEKHAKVAAGGYSSTRHVFHGPVERTGVTMSSSFLSETLKYLFLLFSSEDVLPLHAVVFNTRAHPFPVVSSS